MARRRSSSLANQCTPIRPPRRAVAAALAGLIALSPALVRGEDTVALPEMTVKEQEERADGNLMGQVGESFRDDFDLKPGP